MLLRALFSRHSREGGNPSEFAYSGSLLVVTGLASMDSRLRGNDDGVLGASCVTSVSKQ
jgi:hypothetical protein